jgi:UDP-N-acetyl-2-amino-2-deoxyglucuronate dehydrogenase
MVSNRARIALLGAGRVSARYLEVFRDELPDIAEVVAVADKVADKTTRFVEQFGATAVADIDALVAQKPDLVCVLSESGNHARHVIELLNAGINVVVEKPVALRLEDAQAMADAAKASGKICAVIKQNRYNPAIKFLRQAVDQGRFGRMVTAGVRVHWCRYQDYYNDGWHGTWAMDGGVLAQQAIHHLDALNWLAGPVKSVCAAGGAVNNKLEAEDTAVAVLRFESGAFGTIEATTSARPRDFEASLHLVGEKAVAKVGGVAINQIETWAPAEPGPEDADVIERHSQEVPTGYGLGHGPYLREVIDRLREGRTDMAVGVEEAMGALRLLHAIYASMESGGWVDMADNPVSSRLGL